LGSRPAALGVSLSAVILAAILSTTDMASAMQKRLDPETGRLRLLYIGSPFWGTKPGLIFLSDPKINPTLIPAITIWWGEGGVYGDTEEDIHRAMRVYFPRTYDELIARYDMIQLSGCDENVISGFWQHGFTRAVKEGGLGLAMTDGYRGFGGGPQAHSTWEGAYLDVNLLPTNSLTQKFVAGPMWVRVLQQNTLSNSLPFDTAPPLMEINQVTIKDGCTLVMDVRPQNEPLMAYWDVGNGRALSFTCDLHGFFKGSGIWQDRWTYWIDFVLNLDYFVAGMECPDDPATMHSIRASFQSYSTRLALIGDFLAFIEKFGASTKQVDEKLRAVKAIKREVDGMYLQEDYPGTLDGIQKLDEEFKAAEQAAMESKARALLWVYVIEYLSVSGTLMVAGVAVWSLMVRRRLYRVVGTTRRL